MKKLVMLFVAAFCLPMLGLTGCGDGGTKVVEPVGAEVAPVDVEPEDYDAAMEAEMANQPGN